MYHVHVENLEDQCKTSCKNCKQFNDPIDLKLFFTVNKLEDTLSDLKAFEQVGLLIAMLGARLKYQEKEVINYVLKELDKAIGLK